MKLCYFKVKMHFQRIINYLTKYHERVLFKLLVKGLQKISKKLQAVAIAIDWLTEIEDFIVEDTTCF